MDASARDNRPPHHEFALELERARREAGLKSKEIAAALYVDPRTVRRYLNGERLPTLELTDAWERACGIEPGRLVRRHPANARSGPQLVVPAAVAPRDEAPRAADAGAGTARRRRRPVLVAVLGAVVLLAGGAAVLALTLGGGPSRSTVEQTVARAKELKTTYAERTGSSARTWSDYTIAGGEAGPPINGRRAVRVTCRIRGYEVSSGNQWWYLVASAPWRNDFFATADAFYNQRRTQGVDFRKTRFVDPRVRVCP